MTQVFDVYAQYYDFLYQDKDYVSEAIYIAENIKRVAPKARRILELGCGSGGHAEYLAKEGYSIHGVDMSPRMLELAENRKKEMSKDISDRLSFEQGDIRTYRAAEKFDVVISLFHVMSYQTSNEDILAAFQTAFEHLEEGGVFIFDYWNGPAVMTQKPSARIKRFKNNECNIIRVADPYWIHRKNIVEVNYQILFESFQTNTHSEIHEKHIMRYFFEPELQMLAGRFGMKEVNVFGWMKDDQPTVDDWSAMMVLVKERKQ